MYTYALLAPSGATEGILYPQDGLEATRLLEHHVSEPPPSQASPVIPAVLHTTNLTVCESESDAVVDHVTVWPGFFGESLLTAVNPGL
jgi:hypothetical protein